MNEVFTNDRMNIVVAVNDKFVKPLKVMLFSLAENTKRNLDIYLMFCDLSAENRKQLSSFVSSRCHGTLHEVRVDKKAFREHDASHSMFSIETFYRLFIPYILPDGIERALWLDADMVINGNIDEFYDFAFGADGKQLLVACWNDRDREKLTQYKARLGEDLEADSYFNSGVLLFNVPAIRDAMQFEQIMEFWIKNQEKLIFLDQDMINCLMGTRTELKDSTIYNNQAHADEDAEEQMKVAKVIHYITYRKPWLLYYEGKGDKIYWNYAKKCGFGFENLTYKLCHGPVMVIYAIYKKLRYS